MVSPESPLNIPRFHCPSLACFIPWIPMKRSQKTFKRPQNSPESPQNRIPIFPIGFQTKPASLGPQLDSQVSLSNPWPVSYKGLLKAFQRPFKCLMDNRTWESSGGILGGRINKYWGRSPQYSVIYLPQNPPSRFPGFIVQPLACFIPWIFIQSRMLLLAKHTFLAKARALQDP